MVFFVLDRMLEGKLLFFFKRKNLKKMWRRTRGKSALATTHNVVYRVLTDLNTKMPPNVNLVTKH